MHCLCGLNVLSPHLVVTRNVCISSSRVHVLTSRKIGMIRGPTSGVGLTSNVRFGFYRVQGTNIAITLNASNYSSSGGLSVVRTVGLTSLLNGT